MRILLLAVLGTLALAPAAFAAENGRLAFAATGDRLVSTNPDGSGTHILSFAGDVGPAWSPYGGSLAVSSLTSGNGDIFLVSLDGKHRGQLTSSDDAEADPAWAPCACLLAYDRTHDGDAAIYTMSPDGTEQQLLADAPGCDLAPAYSPDGTHIAFTSCRSGRPQIYVMLADGTEVTRLTHDTGSDENPAWSPDGRQIAYDGDAAGYRRIWTVNTDGTNAVPVSPGPFDREPAWSPDGTELAYEDYDLFVHVQSMTGVRTSLVAYNGHGVAWQPVDAVPGCTRVGTQTDDYVAGGDGSDVVCALDGNDEIVGGAGPDILRAGGGEDVIDARDGEPDFVFGGAGYDMAVVDRGDRVAAVEYVRYVEPRNLARGRPAQASLSFADGPPSFAVDGDRVLWWASYYAPQWIEIDLGRPSTIRRLELVVAQTPPGNTLHVVRGRRVHDGPLVVLHTFSGWTQDKDVLTFAPRRPWRGIRFVRVDTYESPSWVAWKEIRVLR